MISISYTNQGIYRTAQDPTGYNSAGIDVAKLRGVQTKQYIPNWIDPIVKHHPILRKNPIPPAVQYVKLDLAPKGNAQGYGKGAPNNNQKLFVQKDRS